MEDDAMINTVIIVHNTIYTESPSRPYIPHLLSPDNVTAPFPETPTFVKGSNNHHRRLSSNGSSIGSFGCTAPFGSPLPNFSSLVISVQEIDESLPERSPKMSPVRRGYRSRRPPHIETCKGSRYEIGVLGDNKERPIAAEKPSMGWKMMRTNHRVVPLRRTKSERGYHRRDSFASLPPLSDIGIDKDDLLDMGPRARVFSCET